MMQIERYNSCLCYHISKKRLNVISNFLFLDECGDRSSVRVRHWYQGQRPLDYFDDLHEAITDAWDRMLQTYIDNLVSSIPARCASVLLSSSGPTKYRSTFMAVISRPVLNYFV